MDKVFVVWKSYHKPEILDRGYWDQGLLEDLFKKPQELVYEHVYDVSEVPEGQGAVFIINGRTHVEDTAKINADIAKLRWVLFIETGDEEASFPWREIKHPIMRVWIMLPRMNQHDDVSFHLPNGYRPTTHKLLQEIGPQPRQFDWFFAGQVNHDRRQQCVAELKYLVDSQECPNGVLSPTTHFGEEKIDYKTYLTGLARSKIALCPSGVESPDNFRLYEALEAGCLPVVDAFATNNQSLGFWEYLFGDDLPFPVVKYWDELPKLMPKLLADYPNNANKVFAWWQQKKRDMLYKLQDDIKELAK